MLFFIQLLNKIYSNHTKTSSFRTNEYLEIDNKYVSIIVILWLCIHVRQNWISKLLSTLWITLLRTYNRQTHTYKHGYRLLHPAGPKIQVVIIRIIIKEIILWSHPFPIPCHCRPPPSSNQWRGTWNRATGSWASTMTMANCRKLASLDWLVRNIPKDVQKDAMARETVSLGPASAMQDTLATIALKVSS